MNPHLLLPSARCLPVIAMAFLTFQPAHCDPADPLASVLDPLRAKYNLPSLAGAIFNTNGVVEMAAVGVRKAGTSIPVTVDDMWHLGSDTKMMTAALAGTFVAEGKLSWDAKIISFFPEIADQVSPEMANVTLAQVLAHQAGLKENLDWHALSQSGSVTDQRQAAAELALMAPAYLPGAYHYANTDYVVVGAILEKIGGKPWEDLISERIFQPLGMDSVGFGGLGTPGEVDEPWPHFSTGLPVSDNGPLVDNPEIMGPAGTVHCTIRDWTRFLVDQLRGGAGMRALLPMPVYQAMQEPGASARIGYGFGWSLCERPWAGGLALNHNGTNNLNFAVCWLAPAKKFGVLVCTNQGGDVSRQACDEASSAMIQRYLARLNAQEEAEQVVEKTAY
jgi:CubicO group peptidase (beta-lactamase class C family)